MRMRIHENIRNRAIAIDKAETEDAIQRFTDDGSSPLQLVVEWPRWMNGNRLGFHWEINAPHCNGIMDGTTKAAVLAER